MWGCVSKDLNQIMNVIKNATSAIHVVLTANSSGGGGTLRSYSIMFENRIAKRLTDKLNFN